MNTDPFARDTNPLDARSREIRSGIAIPKLIFGLSLILIGVAYSLDRLGWVDAADLVLYWPALMIAAGIGKLIDPGSSSSRFTGVLLTGVGALLLGDNLDLLRFDFESLLPLALVLIGLRLVFIGLWPRRRQASAESVSTIDGLVLLGGGRRSNNSADFRGGDLMAVMGGFNVDLRGARIANGPAVIDVFAFWGGIDIQVPEDWAVTIRGIPLLGGFEDKTHQSPTAAGAASGTASGAPRQELIIKGFAIMGGIDVKN
jgi:hypothetical protein